MFPTSLTKFNDRKQLRVAMPASTKIISAGEVKDNFLIRRSLFDTGTDAYLRQDERLKFPIFPSSTVIHIAGSEQLKAWQTGLLHFIVKDDKGNLHELMLENALVAPKLSQNLTSHKQFVENGHMVFFHQTQAGIVLNKKPKFGENGLYYVGEHVPEDGCAKNAKTNQRGTCAYTTMSCLPVIDETHIPSNTSSEAERSK